MTKRVVALAVVLYLVLAFLWAARAVVSRTGNERTGSMGTHNETVDE